jgi:hypothetical protein
MGAWQNGQWGLFSMAKDMKREQEIFDKGYNAVRQMAKEMVENGASLSDILFHANQVWHEFKVGAIAAGFRAVDEFVKTGPYIDSYDAELTNKIIRADKRYKSGADSVRVAVYESRTGGGTELSPNLVTKSAKAGK